MAGMTDVFNRLSLALSLWNGRDPILKERMFGLAGPEGNHGEDVKEYWWYLDAVPSSAWLRWRYHYPQAAFPYEDLVQTNRARSKFEPEYELIDTGIFDDDRYWIVEVHYAKASTTDILMRITARNRGPETATLHVLPTLWFRNEWSWNPGPAKPELRAGPDGRSILASHPELGDYALDIGPGPDGTQPTLLFCENETNRARIEGRPADHAVSEGRDQRPRRRRRSDGQPGRGRHEGLAVVPAGRAARRDGRAPAAPAQAAQDREARAATARSLRSRRPRRRRGATARPRRRTSARSIRSGRRSSRRCSGASPRRMSSTRRSVAKAGPTTSNGSCARRSPGCSGASSTTATTSRAGSMATRDCRRPHRSGKTGRNADWRHFDAADILSMPDPWEYPWFAAWDLAFHAVTLAHIDPAFAKYQLLLHVSRMVPAPGRGAARLRMVLRRRQPAGPRGGRLPRLRDRRPPRLPVPAPDLPQAADQLHVVAQPRGQGGQRPLLGRLPRPRQHRRLRPIAPAGRRPSSSSRTRPPGCSSTA